MKEEHVDTLHFIVGLIKSDAYLSFYFSSMCKQARKDPAMYQATLEAFTAMRVEIKEDKNRDKNKKDIFGTTIDVLYAPEKKKLTNSRSKK